MVTRDDLHHLSRPDGIPYFSHPQPTYHAISKIWANRVVNARILLWRDALPV